MQQHRLVDRQFGQVAQAYFTSAVHAQGADLDALAALAQSIPQAKVLDLGCGGGHELRHGTARGHDGGGRPV